MSETKSQRPLANKGFLSLVLTQFFGVANDNLLKQVLTFGLAAAGIWKGTLGEGGQSYVAAALVLPFLLMSITKVLRSFANIALNALLLREDNT